MSARARPGCAAQLAGRPVTFTCNCVRENPWDSPPEVSAAPFSLLTVFYIERSIITLKEKMSVAIANAQKQYVFRRNYNTRKWESLAGDGKTCRIQVLKKPTGDYILRIFPEEGEVMLYVRCSKPPLPFYSCLQLRRVCK